MMIEYFGLKQVLQDTCFQHFYNEAADIRLTVSGVGEIAAAAAVSHVCTEYKPAQTDFLFNIGACAASDGIDGMFLVNKLTEEATGKTFYPDILYRHSFREAELVTAAKHWTGKVKSAPGANAALSLQAAAEPADVCNRRAAAGNCLYDMEAAAVYQAGTYFFGPHQMLFLKVVSDHGRADAVSSEQLRQLMAGCREEVLEFLGQLRRIASDGKRQECARDTIEQGLLTKVSEDMHCTKVMRDSFRQYVRYLELTGVDVEAVIYKLYVEKLLPCKDKREGKRCLAEIKKRVF